jgi:hypothetical protein
LDEQAEVARPSFFCAVLMLAGAGASPAAGGRS